MLPGSIKEDSLPPFLPFQFGLVLVLYSLITLFIGTTQMSSRSTVFPLCENVPTLCEIRLLSLKPLPSHSFLGFLSFPSQQLPSSYGIAVLGLKSLN